MKKLLILIVIIAAFLRFFQLGTNPPSLTWDEVAWGYNAYSLGLDGKDEFGKFLPYQYLESFGDFKPPVYAYLTVLPVMIFGLNEFAVRFASAMFGTLTVLVTYFLVNALFYSENSEHSENRNVSKSENRRDRKFSEFLIHLTNLKHWRSELSEYSERIALLSAFLLAISPWHIMLSRAAFEANIGTFFIATGMWLFLESLQRRPWLLTLSAVSFGLSVYTFNTPRIVAPLLLVTLAILYWKKLLKIKQSVITAAIVGLVLVLPTVPFLLSPQAKLRFMEVNIFSDIKVVEMANQEIANDHGAVWSKILHNRRFEYGLSYLSHYFDNLSFDFLFIKGDGNPKFSIQSMGQMYLWELPFLLLGILFLFKKREGNWKIIPLWILLAIVPAGTARETPHALRIENALPMFQVLVAYGLVNAAAFLKKNHEARIMKQGLRVFTILYLLFALFTTAFYFEDYYNHYAKTFSADWQYGYKDAVTYAHQVESQYDAIYLTDTFGRPYIYTLFYTHYDPKKFRQDAIVKREALGFVTVQGFDKYYFDKSLLSGVKRKNTLYFDVPEDVPGGVTVKKMFYFLNGQVALVAYTM